MLLAWIGAFVAAGFRPDDLQEATTWLAANEPPRYRPEHLDAIRRRIGQRRREQAVANREAAVQDGFRCSLCLGGGWVQVIRPDCVIDGHLVADAAWGCGPFVNVACNCKRGEQIVQSLLNPKHSKAMKAMRLEEYETRVPHWPDLMAELSAQRAATAQAMTASRHADKVSIKPMLAGILDRLRNKPKG